MYTHNKKILLTGGTGLVGSAFLPDECLKKLSSKECNLTKLNEVNAIFEKFNPEFVIHCAAKVGGVGFNSVKNGEIFLDNVRMNINVLEACRVYNVKKLVSFLSTCIFPEEIDYPLTENKIFNGEPHVSNYGYAYAKRMLAVQSKVYKDQYNSNFISVIPTNIYGPNDNFSINHGHVIPSLIHKCLNAKKTGTKLRVWGSGSALREFIFAKDVAKLTMWIMKNYNSVEPIILSTSNEISISYLVDLIVKCVGFKGKVIFDKDRPEGLFRKPTDNTRLKNLLPKYQFTSIEEGIEETVNWFEKNYEIARK